MLQSLTTHAFAVPGTDANGWDFFFPPYAYAPMIPSLRGTALRERSSAHFCFVVCAEFGADIHGIESSVRAVTKCRLIGMKESNFDSDDSLKTPFYANTQKHVISYIKHHFIRCWYGRC